MWRKEVNIRIITFNVPKNSLLLCSCLVVAYSEGLVMKCPNFGDLTVNQSFSIFFYHETTHQRATFRDLKSKGPFKVLVLKSH